MRCMDGNNRQAHRFSPCVSHRPARRFAVPRLEELEARLNPNITLTNALLVDSHDHALTPDKGEQVFVEADWSTQGLPRNASYRVSYTIDSVTLYTNYFSFGAGSNSTQYWYWYLGGWFASLGTHNVTVSIDPTSYGTTSRSFTFTPISAPDLPQKFITPLGGTPFQTWGFVNYVDVDPRSGSFADYKGGPYTYDGHTGHDMTLANFASMDAGVADYAVAAGTVVAVQDGNYDRNTAVNNVPANYVEIDNGNGWHTIYYHFRTNTILVHLGDRVVAGQVLGLAGSSGSSTLAHLHFEVQHNGDIVEPEDDPSTFWVNPLPYQGTVRSVLDSGVSSPGATTGMDLSAEERPVAANVFSQASGQQISVWFQGYMAANDNVVFKVYKPDGTHYPSLDYSFTTTLSRGDSRYYYANLPGNLDLGTWHVGIEINGTEMARDSFQVTAAGAGAARVTQGSTYVANGRTTPIEFGTVSPGSTPPQRTFTVSNMGSATLTLSTLVLPSGFLLVGSFPSSIAVSSTAKFTLQMATATAGTDAGIVQFNSSDPNAPTYSFDVQGTVSGGNTGAIHGQVFDDANGDGIENGTEAGLASWTVALINPADNSVITTTTTGYNGYYAFLNLAAGTYRVRETPPAGWTQSTRNPADVRVGTGDVLASPLGVGVYLPTHLTVSAPANATAGTPITFTVTAQDAFNNTAGGYAGTVHFMSSDGQGVLPSDYTFTSGDAGVHIFTNGVTLKTAASQSITATDMVTSSIAGSSPTIAVSPAAAIQFTISAPGGATAGAAFDLIVTALDPYGNTDINYQGTVQFRTSDATAGQLPAIYTFTAADNGAHSFAAGAVLLTAGSQTVTAIDTASGINGTATVLIAPAPADHFALAVPAQVTAGVPFDLTITAMDPYGNTDINYQGTLHFSSSDTDPGVVLPADYTFAPSDKGVQTFAGGFTLVTAGMQTLTATDTANAALTGAATVTVDPGGNGMPPGGASRRDRLAFTPVIEPTRAVGTTWNVQPDQRVASVDRLFTSRNREEVGFLFSRFRHGSAGEVLDLYCQKVPMASSMNDHTNSRLGPALRAPLLLASTSTVVVRIR